ncbi:hypothetical protein BVI1335_2120004 [Burkholderia vietnamiensis]|nr:hypothetical protein BVI1335_2120004 [Burkholderia vietnamiensis]
MPGGLTLGGAANTLAARTERADLIGSRSLQPAPIRRPNF